MKLNKPIIWIFLALGLLWGGYFYYKGSSCSSCETTSIIVQEQSENTASTLQKPYENTILVNKGETLFVDGKPTPELMKVLTNQGIVATTPEAIMEETQGKWLGNVSDSKHIKEKTDATPPVAEELDLYRQIGMVDALVPTQKKYTYAIVLGTVTRFMADAVDYLIYLWEKEGVRFEKLIFLAGDRPLYGEYVTFDRVPQRLLNSGEPQPTLKTESDAAKFLANRMAPNFPQGFPKGENIMVVEAKVPAGHVIYGKAPQIRANRKDTLQALLDLRVTPGSYIAVSQQPFAGREAVTLEKGLASAGFNGEVVATHVLDKMPKSFYLDSLARWIYELVKG